MNAAREVRVVLSGEDKAEAVLTGISRSKAVLDFPGCGVAKVQHNRRNPESRNTSPNIHTLWLYVTLSSGDVG